jgi:hypothetical protein
VTGSPRVQNVVQIVPEIPPAIGGVTGYAEVLAGALAGLAGIESRFVSPRAGGLDRELAGANTLLLHYANYGYARRGCPAELVAGVERWKTGGTGRRLVTVFHEVYASGPPWRSSFWLSPWQRRLAARLAALSDGLLTTLGLYAGLLERLAPGVQVTVAPVFSTVGEPAGEEAGSRPAVLAVFGGAGARARAYGEALPDLAAACRALAVEEILDIGPDIGANTGPPGRVAGLPVRRMGTLPAGEVSRQLLAARAGFLAYPPGFLAKSTIFAAYCAHGLAPVCAWKGRGGGTADAPLWRAAGPDVQQVAAAARGWYRGHALARQVATYRRLLAGDGP